MTRIYQLVMLISVIGLWPLSAASADGAPIKVALDWSKVIATSKSNIAIQDCPEPPLYRGRPLHDKIYQALRVLNADYSRIQPWFPYPKLAVAELKPPDQSKTYWDFNLMDSVVEDFMTATAGHPVVFQPGTIPSWMLTSASSIHYPEDPQAIDWTYSRDGKVNASSAALLADYQARMASWYIKGGFKDELGVWHPSGHAYNFEYWEPMNEEDQRFSPEELTELYDASVAAVRKIAPGMKFMGPTLSNTVGLPEFVAYFFDPKNHQPGTPIDSVSYHFYAVNESDETPEIMQRTMFRQADQILSTVGYIEAFRKRFLPQAKTDITELGSIWMPAEAVDPHPSIPASYWSLSGSAWAYMYGHLAAKGIDILTAAELIDYPGQFAGTTLVNWETGEPNARYWVVKLLHDNFGPDDKLTAPNKVDELTQPDPAVQIYAQGFITPHGIRKVLLVNKRDRALDVAIAGAAGGEEQHVDQSTVAQPVAHKLTEDTVHLAPSEVAVLSLSH
jgi:hypothetical protein